MSVLIELKFSFLAMTNVKGPIRRTNGQAYTSYVLGAGRIYIFGFKDSPAKVESYSRIKKNRVYDRGFDVQANFGAAQNARRRPRDASGSERGGAGRLLFSSLKCVYIPYFM